MAEQPSSQEILFEIETPLGFHVRTTVSHWNLMTTVKHPVLRGREADVQATLFTSDEIRLSKADSKVYLLYRYDGERRWMCAVTKGNVIGFEKLNFEMAGQGPLHVAFETVTA